LKIIIEIIGWTAAVMMLSAYLLLSSGRLRSLSPAYQWLNLRLKDLVVRRVSEARSEHDKARVTCNGSGEIPAAVPAVLTSQAWSRSS
jgi:hypothetical protein